MHPLLRMLCTCCGREVCGCPSDSTPTVEACGFGSADTQLTWSLEHLPFTYSGERFYDYVNPNDLSGPFDYTGILIGEHFRAGANYSVELVNPTGLIDAGPMVTRPLPTYGIVGTVLHTSDHCRVGVAGVYARGSASQFANGPVEFDTLTDTGLPRLAVTSTYTGHAAQDLYGVDPGPSVDYEADPSTYAYTSLAWGRDGSVGLAMRAYADSSAKNFVGIYPLDTTYVPLPRDPADRLHLPYPSIYPNFDGTWRYTMPDSVTNERRYMAHAEIVAGPSGTCDVPADATINTLADEAGSDDFHEDESDEGIPPGVDRATDEHFSYRYVEDPPGSGLRRIIHARLSSASIDGAASLPTNPGCRSCRRAYRVVISNPHVPTDAKQVDGVFVQRCIPASSSSSISRDDRSFPFECAWDNLDLGPGRVRTLVKRGPSLWELDFGTDNDRFGQGVFLKGRGDCPTSITESMFFPVGIPSPPDEGGFYAFAGRYDISITAADAPDGYECHCDDGGCGCADAPTTITAVTCSPFTLTRVSSEPCRYEGTAGSVEVTLDVVDTDDGPVYRLYFFEPTVPWEFTYTRPCADGLARVYAMDILHGNRDDAPCIRAFAEVG